MLTILAIESSCDDTAAAVIKDKKILSNIVSSQAVHAAYGGVVPEMASREHMQNIVQVVQMALEKAAVKKEELNAVAFTQSPGLIGSLLVGAGFAKTMAQALNIPLLSIHHMQAHVMAHFIENPQPDFPFLCLTVSGGHTQLVLCRNHFDMEILGSTIDDAAGEAFDKTAKILGLPYPGGPLIDQKAQLGNPLAYPFPITVLPDFNFSFSGIKTAVLYFIKKELQKDPHFIDTHINDICASVQHSIIKMLLTQLEAAAKKYDVKNIGIAGGVSANSGLRKAIQQLGEKNNWTTFIPDFQYCTDNAAMIAMTAHYKYLKKEFAPLDIVPMARAAW